MAATFRTHVDVDEMVIGVTIERWCKGPTLFRVKVHNRPIVFSFCKYSDDNRNFFPVILKVRIFNRFR